MKFPKSVLFTFKYLCLYRDVMWREPMDKNIFRLFRPTSVFQKVFNVHVASKDLFNLIFYDF